MNIPIPDFVPVFSAEAIQLISVILLIAGVCVTAAGAILLSLNKRKEKGQNALARILICVGVLLIVNHGLQLIF